MEDVVVRPRRLRTGKLVRDLVSDIKLDLSDFIYPLFVKSGKEINNPVLSMPGVSQMSVDVALKEIETLSSKGVKNFILFAVIDEDKKDETGSIALCSSNPVNELSRQVKEKGIDALIIADLCYCEYTSHGHCGILSKDKNEAVDNDKTLEILSKQAVSLANNGVDIVAPSGMMDGMISAIRNGLDSEGYKNIPIMSYSTKYASSLYGPFRDAAGGASDFGDRKSYQMDIRRSSEWQMETELDIAEGADMLMVKPAMYYLDVISKVKAISNMPVGAYQVSGEYSMIHAAAQNDWLNLKDVALESLYCLKRAGADYIVSYFAKDLIDWLE